MATKLKKSHKLTTIIITLCILVPAFLLVALYPRVGKVMQEKKAENLKYLEELEKEYEESQVIEGWVPVAWGLNTQFINYAMETSYYLYGQILQERGLEVDFRIIEEHGWDNDYWTVHDSVRYHAVHDNGESVIEKKNADSIEDALGHVTMTFDSYGYLQDIAVEGELLVDEEETGEELRARAKRSIEQYKNNVSSYEQRNGVEFDETQLMPKNFTITFAIDSDCEWVYSSGETWVDDYDYEYYHYTNSEYLLLESGAIILMIAAGIFVALAALVLPFFKKLETGWEKPFRIPFEFVIGLIIAGIVGAYGMFCAMAETCDITSYPQIEFLGNVISDRVQYSFLLVMNFLGWAALFFAEYIVIASLRQFFCGPKLYIRNRVLCVRILCWIKKQCIRLYAYVTDVNVTEKLHGSIIKIVLANFVILTVLCVMWFFGIVGLVLYSVGLYILLRKYGEKIQKQYNSVLQATRQMAEGNLKISLEEDLGLFKPIGESLEKVQQGFEKAVVEEAKSQNMKTELITNVSHDLKTPLTAIITYVDLLKREDITEEERKSYVQTLEQKSQRLKVLIEDLFEVSKAHSGNVTMNFMEVDIVSLMKQVRMEMSDQIEASNLTFRWNLPEEKILLSLDGQRTYRVFENLLNNALKYAMPHSRVYVDVLNSTTDVKVVFRNISAQELNYEPQQLTERFVRGDVSRNSEGSGLGLAIAKSFVELQNGKLNIEVDGDLFKVTLIWTK